MKIKEKAMNLITKTSITMLLCASAFALSLSAYKLYQIQKGYSESRNTYNAISDEYTKTAITPITQSKLNGSAEKPTRPEIDEENDEKFPLSVDFNQLLAKTNDEIVAWIYCPNTVINYPVAHHSDNKFYLNYDITRNRSYNGAIFLETNNFANFSDRNNIVHGHHMNDGSMFGSLEKWQKEEYYNEHPVFYLSTVYSGDYIVEVCAAFTTPADSTAYQFEFTGRNDMESWINWIRSQSTIQPELDLSCDDHFLTLSTCAYSFENARSVLIGRMRSITPQS